MAHDMLSSPDSSFFDWGVGFVSVAGSMIATIFVTGWRVRSGIEEIKAKIIKDIEDKIDHARLEISADIHNEHEIFVHRYGETMSAFRQKRDDTERAWEQRFSSMELWGRDHFVQKAELAQVTSQFTRQFETLTMRMDASFVKVEQKIDTVTRETLSKFHKGGE